MQTSFRKLIVAAAATASVVALGGGAHAQPTKVKNVVLVHGAFADGSGWRGVYNELTGRGYRVTIVQNPLTSLADDVAATKRALAAQDGPTILVGHSWGGTVITEAGVDPKVVGLVYVSALSPDAGETTSEQYTGFTAPDFVLDVGAQRVDRPRQGQDPENQRHCAQNARKVSQPNARARGADAQRQKRAEARAR